MADLYTQLLEWRRGETTARGLSKLPPDYYLTTRTYLAELRRSYESELRENPSGRKGEISRQTYQRAGQVARDVVEARMTKILSIAFQASIGGSRDLPNALGEERALFDTLLETLYGHRRAVAPYLDPTPGPLPANPPAPAPAATSVPPTATPAAAPLPASSRTGTVYVRILKDGRPIDTGRETIELRKEDILSLPAETARLLVDGKIAERITPGAPPSTT